jgi:hypothetical protein
LNTYLYIMELIFIKILGKLVCDYDTLHNYIEKDLPACFLTVNSTGASFEILSLNCIW